MSVVSPPLVPLVAAPNTSLLPIQIEMNVGCAFAAICTCVSPPRKNCVSEFACAPAPLVYTSLTRAPGTAVLLMNGGVTACVLRSAQVVGVPPLSRAPVNTFVYGGGQPGLFINGEKNVVRIMGRSSSEGVGKADAEQVALELVETGIPDGRIHRAAPVVLVDVLVGQVGVQLGRQLDAGTNGKLVARAFGQ